MSIARERDPLVLGVSDDVLAPKFQLVAWPVVPCISLCDDLDLLASDVEDGVAWVHVHKTTQTQRSGNESIKSKSFTGPSGARTENFFFTSSMEPRSPL